MDLKTLDGTIRESIRVYRELAEGRIPVLEAEARGRQLARHAMMLKERAEDERVRALVSELTALRLAQATATATPALPAPEPSTTWAEPTPGDPDFVPPVEGRVEEQAGEAAAGSSAGAGTEAVEPDG